MDTRIGRGSVFLACATGVLVAVAVAKLTGRPGQAAPLLHTQPAAPVAVASPPSAKKVDREPGTLDPLRDAIKALSLQPDEMPAAYASVTATNVLAKLGMQKNPDLVTHGVDVGAVASRGGVLTFAAIYGLTNDARLMLNGIFFPKTNQLDDFVVFQRAKNCHVMALRKRQPDGAWLLMIARDPALDYHDDELREVELGCARYRERLGLDLLFDDLCEIVP
jgi:hypothetical protein